MDAKPDSGTEGGITAGVLEPERVYSSEPEDDGGNVIPFVEPSSVEGNASGSDTRSKRRGRPRGSRNLTSIKQEKQVSTDLSGILYSLHLMGAAILNVKELQLDKEEAKNLGDAVARVNSLYDGLILSEKQLAWVNLAMVGGTIYGPRFVAYSQRMKNEKKNTQPKNPATEPHLVH